MSGPDRRETRLINSEVLGGSIDDEDSPGDSYYTVTVTGWGHRAYHIRCDVDMPLVGDETESFTIPVDMDVDAEFIGRLSLYGWNGQEIFDSYAAIKRSRDEYMALDVAADFIVDSYGEQVGGEVEGEVDG